MIVYAWKIHWGEVKTIPQKKKISFEQDIYLLKIVNYVEV